MDAFKTTVIFLLDKEGDVFAYFPTETWDHNGNMTCYAHVGQHSACSPDYARECQKAYPSQYKELLAELTSIGYNLKIK